MARVPDWLEAARGGWRYRGQERPPFAAIPKPGQESVWDYPRPPRLERDEREVIVRAADRLIARTNAALRLLETASPPTFYLPPDDVDRAHLAPGRGSSMCEWKGEARYWDVLTPDGRLAKAAWSYEAPFDDFAPLAGHIAFYPTVLACFVGGARVTPQPGGFYGGWVTPELVGPFKGEPGSGHW